LAPTFTMNSPATPLNQGVFITVTNSAMGIKNHSELMA